MRTITTTTTGQLAIALANQEARVINAAEEFPRPDHTVTADDQHASVVLWRVNAIVNDLNQSRGGAATLDQSALLSGQAAVVQAEYLRKRDAGHYAEDEGQQKLDAGEPIATVVEADDEAAV